MAPSTDPGWTPLFLRASAVVTETGGYLSHGAVVAREFGLPAVVNVRDAMRLIADGDRLRVDGDAGRVARTERSRSRGNSRGRDGSGRSGHRGPSPRPGD